MLKKIIVLLPLIFSISILFGCSQEGDKSNEDLLSLSDKKIVFFGDSITQNFEVEGESYPDIISEETGASVVNFGFGGTSLSLHPNKSFDTFAFHSLADAIVSSDFSVQEDALDDPEIPAYFAEKLKKLEEIDWNHVDIISIMYGSNDWGNPLDSENDLFDIKTFKGAGRYSLDKILTKYPHLQVLFVPMTYRFWPEFGDLDTDSSINAYGLKPYQYSDAMGELAREFKFPYADTLHSLGINKYNRKLYFNSEDGTHPNKKGTRKIADKIAKTLLFYF